MMAGFTVDLVSEGIRQASEFVAEESRFRFCVFTEYLKKTPHLTLESPLEELFFVWWNAYVDVHHGYLESLGGFWLDRQQEVTINNQTFRLDFVVVPEGPRKNWKPIAVELDGHEFHERTRAQVRQRDRRDRILSRAGWTVLHFSFGEFTSDPLGSIHELTDLVQQHALASRE